MTVSRAQQGSTAVELAWVSLQETAPRGTIVAEELIIRKAIQIVSRISPLSQRLQLLLGEVVLRLLLPPIDFLLHNKGRRDKRLP